MSNNMNHHIKVYRNVFIGLLIFTILTVSASYFEFNYVWLGVTVGLLIAFIISLVIVEGGEPIPLAYISWVAFSRAFNFFS